MPRVELLWWKGCASYERALEELRSIMAQEGLDPDTVEVREIDTEHAAATESFVGSPTIRIDGRDVQPPLEDASVALTCRVYRLRDGRYSPTPDPDDVRDALRAAGADPPR
ncbi:MAG: thioredoxin family protein [Chloroflexota bacterium]|nr:thioredoxin family protein [Chloroflexota bacterium]